MAQAVAPKSAATSAKVLWHQNCYGTTFMWLPRWLKAFFAEFLIGVYAYSNVDRGKEKGVFCRVNEHSHVPIVDKKPSNKVICQRYNASTLCMRYYLRYLMRGHMSELVNLTRPRDVPICKLFGLLVLK
ncbi:hypothetical protein Tco_0401932 [Tanacetum coccineum]